MNLDDWRSRINDFDKELLNLLNQRAEAALRIGDLKRRKDLAYFVPEREAEIVDRLVKLNRGPLPADAVRAIWREILSASLALERPLRVSYLGPPATFTHQAAIQRFGNSAELAPARTIVEVFEDVERGRTEYGVVPVENSTEGSVHLTLDRLIESEVLISGELLLEVAQHLVSRAADLPQVKTVCSHPQALAQCRAWLAEHLPEAAVEEVGSTAAAVGLAASDASVAAIASELAARLYDVPILCARIEDGANNSTRFLVVGRRPMGATGRDKTSILFSTRNEPGALFRILEPFAANGLNLTKIESRPGRQQPWEYVMFIDFEGHRDTPVVEDVLARGRDRALFFKILGSYPAA
ncbi:MAG: prephenate dehydratase [Candidatus Rokuibacteriota bacterium]|nr:MAG: prephenate dehydratase [Candidatus Rokubacteria bacterium]